jgi:hypothetical protein
MEEGRQEILNFDHLSSEDKALSKQAKAIFPTAFPLYANQLTNEQKDFLLKQGAAKTLLLLGRIKTTYPLSAGDNVIKLFEQVNQLGTEQYQSEVAIAAIHKAHIMEETYPPVTLGDIVKIRQNRFPSLEKDNSGLYPDQLRPDIHDSSAHRLRGANISFADAPVGIQLGALVFGALAIAFCCRRPRRQRTESSPR